MKALSIRQPWAWLIVRPDLTDPAVRATPHLLKNVENRDWNPHNPGLRFRGEFLIHASQAMTKAELEACALFRLAIAPLLPGGQLDRLLPFNFDQGGIIGRAEIADAVHTHPSPWFTGPVGLVLKNIQPLPFRPCRGRLGFFTVE